MAKKWIQDAVPPSHRGKFTAYAKKKGEGVQEAASKVIAKNKKHKVGSTLLHEAILAKTFKRMAARRKAK